MSVGNLHALLRSIGMNGPPLTNDGLQKVLEADRAQSVRFIEQKADKLSRNGGRTAARHLRVVASDIRAGIHLTETAP